MRARCVSQGLLYPVSESPRLSLESVLLAFSFSLSYYCLFLFQADEVIR